MKRHMLVALVVLSAIPGVAPAQEAKPQMPAAGMSAGMMGQGMMSGMMGQCKEMMSGGMMPGGMMGPEMMGSMMPSMMEGMMPGKTRGCMMMAEGMMKGQMDMSQMRKMLAMSEEQSDRLRTGLRPFQKEAILTLAAVKVAELDLADLLAGEKVDFGKVEAKLKEIETMRTKVRLAHLKAADGLKGVLSKEQLEKLQGAIESSPAPATAAPASLQKGATPGADAGHEQHH